VCTNQPLQSQREWKFSMHSFNGIPHWSRDPDIAPAVCSFHRCCSSNSCNWCMQCHCWPSEEASRRLILCKHTLEWVNRDHRNWTLEVSMRLWRSTLLDVVGRRLLFSLLFFSSTPTLVYAIPSCSKTVYTFLSRHSLDILEGVRLRSYSYGLLVSIRSRSIDIHSFRNRTKH